METNTTNANIESNITFLDANGNTLTQSQAFQGFTNYFVTSAKLLKFVSKPTEIQAGRKSLNYIYESLVRPEMVEDHLLGEEVHQKARKGKRTYEVTVKVNKKFSTLPDEFDGLIDQYRGNGKFVITDTALKSHAQEVAQKVDKEILKAHFALKRNSGAYANVSVIDVTDIENFTKEESNKLANKLLRKSQEVRNKITSQNVNREEAPSVAMINPVIYSAIAQSDFYRAYSPANSESATRTGKLVGDKFGGLELVEIAQLDPINATRFPEFANSGIIISMDNIGGDAVTEPATSDVAGASTVQTYNIRGILGFGPTRNEEDQRIEFIDVTTSGTAKPSSVVEVKSIDGKEIKVTAFVKDGTTPKVKIVKKSDGSIVGAAQDVTATPAEYTFTVLTAGDYYAVTTTGSDVNVAKSDLIIVE